jgi:hypothetical protein
MLVNLARLLAAPNNYVLSSLRSEGLPNIICFFIDADDRLLADKDIVLTSIG